jgi:hypothetical protein
MYRRVVTLNLIDVSELRTASIIMAVNEDSKELQQISQCFWKFRPWILT